MLCLLPGRVYHHSFLLCLALPGFALFTSCVRQNPKRLKAIRLASDGNQMSNGCGAADQRKEGLVGVQRLTGATTRRARMRLEMRSVVKDRRADPMTCGVTHRPTDSVVPCWWLALVRPLVRLSHTWLTNVASWRRHSRSSTH